MDPTAQQAPVSMPAELPRDSLARPSRKEAIAQLGRRSLFSRDVDGLLSMAVELVCRVLKADYASVLHQPGAGEALVMTAGSGWPDEVRPGETTVPHGHSSQAGFTLLLNETVFVEDLGRETRFAASPLAIDHGVASGLTVVISIRDKPYGVLGVYRSRRHRFTVGDAHFMQSVANILGSAIDSRRTVAQVEQAARFETALAECAQALLASSGEDRIQHALESLFIATEATYVYVERNVVDAELGFCTQVVAEAEDSDTGGDYELDNEYWDLVPWDRLPTSRASLEAGKPVVIIPEELEGPEYEQYAADPFPVKSELEIPIFVNGEWTGLIGFSDQDIVRAWTETDVSLLTTVAGMIGAFWEREADRERLEQLNRAKDAFLASVSHELRTPLTAVVGFGQILQESAETMSAAERAELLDMVVTHGVDLTNMISDLLVAARADLGDLHVASVPVNLRAQVAQVLESLEQDQAAHIELIGNSVRAVGDPDRVRQIVRNLVSNALRYGGDVVRIEVRGDNTTASVLVYDSGPAIPEEDRRRIFEPYQRAHNAPGLAESIGLGLAISRQLAKLMDGDLTYRHERGESIFELALPNST